MLVVEYWSICAPYPSPLNKYEKLYNLDFGTFSKFISLFFSSLQTGKNFWA